ncbi:MAG: lysylphosphatidylglycerol synthase transmembrane domain-containing protein [Acidobacteriota bacterium]
MESESQRPEAPVEESGGRRSALPWIVGLSSSVVFFLLAARGVEWPALRSALAALTQPAALLLTALCAALTLLRLPARAARWLLLLRPLGEVTWARLVWVTTFGATLDNLLPARAGDFARAAILRRDGFSASGVLATIVVERVVDIFAALLLLAVTLWVVPWPPWIETAALATAAMAVGAVAALLLAARFRRLAEGLVHRLAGPLPSALGHRLEGLAEAFLGGLDAALRRRHLPGLLVISALIQLTHLAAAWCLILACGLAAGRDAWTASFAVATFTLFAAMVPAAPGQAGTVHFAAVSALTLIGVDQAAALAFAILYHAVGYLPTTLVGGVMLWREGLSWRDPPEGGPAPRSSHVIGAK